jgi:transposase-like protein
MQIKITLHCPDCQSTEIKKNGRKSYGKQNYFCKACGRQFIGDHALPFFLDPKGIGEGIS